MNIAKVKIFKVPHQRFNAWWCVRGNVDFPIWHDCSLTRANHMITRSFCPDNVILAGFLGSFACAYYQ